jgi:hypothetical protein
MAERSACQAAASVSPLADRPRMAAATSSVSMCTNPTTITSGRQHGTPRALMAGTWPLAVTSRSVRIISTVPSAGLGMIAFGFEELRSHRISGAIGPDNAASIAVVSKLGMQYEGRIRDHVYTNAWRDSRDWEQPSSPTPGHRAEWPGRPGQCCVRTTPGWHRHQP